jgi:hypothetical protein
MSDSVFIEKESRNNSSRMILIAIAAVLGLAAIVYGLFYAIRANEESTIRAQLAENLPAMQKIQADIMDYAQRHGGACVSKDGHEGTYGRFDNLFLDLDSMAGQDDGYCAFSLRVRNLSKDADDKTLQWLWNPKHAGAKWQCKGGTLDARFTPDFCQAP